MPVAERIPGRKSDDQRRKAEQGRAARQPSPEAGQPAGAPGPLRPPPRRSALLHHVVLIGSVHRHALTVNALGGSRPPNPLSGGAPSGWHGGRAKGTFGITAFSFSRRQGHG